MRKFKRYDGGVSRDLPIGHSLRYLYCLKFEFIYYPLCNEMFMRGSEPYGVRSALNPCARKVGGTIEQYYEAPLRRDHKAGHP